MSKNLKSCPFCGCKDINLAFIFPDEEDEGWKIAYARECDQCHATTSWFTKEEEADEAWNRRVDHDITPKQTIAATLGSGECHMTEMRFPHENDRSYWLLCDQCGFMVYMRDWWQPVRFCSHCGSKVVDK